MIYKINTLLTLNFFYIVILDTQLRKAMSYMQNVKDGSLNEESEWLHNLLFYESWTSKV